MENMNKANSLVGLLFYEIASYNYSSVNNAINELNENMVTLQKSENDESTKNKIKHIKLTIYKLEKIKRKMEKFNLTKVKQEICEKDFDEKLCQKIKTHYYISNIEYNSILYVVFYRLFKNRVTEENFEIFFRNTSDSICLTDSYSLFTGYPFDKSVLEKLDQKIGTASIDVLLFMNNAALYAKPPIYYGDSDIQEIQAQVDSHYSIYERVKGSILSFALASHTYEFYMENMLPLSLALKKQSSNTK